MLILPFFQVRLPRGALPFFAWLAVLALLAVACSGSRSPTAAVYVLKADGVVNPVMARYIDRGLDSAEKRAAIAVVIQLDTPGGLLSSMNDIVERILGARVPVIVYVSPAGAQAASAGTFITMAAHVAAMAESTRIGAATPVGSGGQDIEGALGNKVTNDAVALITGLAEKRGRNAQWAEDAVRKAAAVNQREALELKVVDLVAPDLPSLLAMVDGRSVELTSGPVTLRTRGAPLVFRNMNVVERFLDILSDPNIAFIFLSLGSLALVIEFLNPGQILPGVAGAIMLLLAFFSLGTLPFNWAGIFLIALAFVLFFLEIFITSHGILGAGGLVALIMGGLLLTSGNPPGFRVSPWLVWGLALAVGVSFVSVVAFILRAGRPPKISVGSALIGRPAVVRSPLNPGGTVYVAGEAWSAMAEDGAVAEGETVVVVGVEGLMLSVRKAEKA